MIAATWSSGLSGRRQTSAISGRIGQASLWIAWPKRVSGLETDLDQQTVREAGAGCRPGGLQDLFHRRDMVGAPVQNGAGPESHATERAGARQQGGTCLEHVGLTLKSVWGGSDCHPCLRRELQLLRCSQGFAGIALKQLDVPAIVGQFWRPPGSLIVLRRQEVCTAMRSVSSGTQSCTQFPHWSSSSPGWPASRSFQETPGVVAHLPHCSTSPHPRPGKGLGQLPAILHALVDCRAERARRMENKDSTITLDKDRSNCETVEVFLVSLNN